MRIGELGLGLQNIRTYIYNIRNKNIIQMMLTDEMRRVILYIQKQRIPGHDVSPNLVNWVANEMGVRNLTSEHVVYISDNFI